MNRVLALGVAALFVVAFSANANAQCCGNSAPMSYSAPVYSAPMYSSGYSSYGDCNNGCCNTRPRRLFARRQMRTSTCCPAPCNTCNTCAPVAQVTCVQPACDTCATSTCGSSGCNTCCQSRGLLARRRCSTCNTGCCATVQAAPMYSSTCGCSGCTSGCAGCGTTGCSGCAGGQMMIESTPMQGGTIVEPGADAQPANPPTPDDT